MNRDPIRDTVIALVLAALILAALFSVGCAPILRKPGQSVEDFCADYALMRWTPRGDINDRRTFGYWYADCVARETP